jgi:hypothetical protein
MVAFLCQNLHKQVSTLDIYMCAFFSIFLKTLKYHYLEIFIIVCTCNRVHILHVRIFGLFIGAKFQHAYGLQFLGATGHCNSEGGVTVKCFFNKAKDLPFSLIKMKFLRSFTNSSLTQGLSQKKILISWHYNSQRFCPRQAPYCHFLFDFCNKYDYVGCAIPEHTSIPLLPKTSTLQEEAIYINWLRLPCACL